MLRAYADTEIELPEDSPAEDFYEAHLDRARHEVLAGIAMDLRRIRGWLGIKD